MAEPDVPVGPGRLRTIIAIALGLKGLLLGLMTAPLLGPLLPLVYLGLAYWLYSAKGKVSATLALGSGVAALGLGLFLLALIALFFARFG